MKNKLAEVMPSNILSLTLIAKKAPLHRQAHQLCRAIKPI